MAESEEALRVELRAAVARGDIRDWTLRNGGRATIYLNNGRKTYTGGTLQTLAVLRRERRDG